MFEFTIYYSDGSLRTHDHVTADLTPKEAIALMWRKYGTKGYVAWTGMSG